MTPHQVQIDRYGRLPKKNEIKCVYCVEKFKNMVEYLDHLAEIHFGHSPGVER